MTSYNVTPANSSTKTQAHVKELNANVCTSTFPSPKGLIGKHYADLYISINGANTLIYSYYDCAPVGCAFKETVLLNFE